MHFVENQPITGRSHERCTPIETLIAKETGGWGFVFWPAGRALMAGVMAAACDDYRQQGGIGWDGCLMHVNLRLESGIKEIQCNLKLREMH